MRIIGAHHNEPDTAMDMRSPRHRRKKSANLSLDGALLAEAKKLGINLSGFMEEKLGEEVKRRRWEKWRVENRAAIEAYNEMVEKHGVFSDGLRRF